MECSCHLLRIVLCSAWIVSPIPLSWNENACTNWQAHWTTGRKHFGIYHFYLMFKWKCHSLCTWNFRWIAVLLSVVQAFFSALCVNVLATEIPEKWVFSLSFEFFLWVLSFFFEFWVFSSLFFLARSKKKPGPETNVGTGFKSHKT